MKAVAGRALAGFLFVGMLAGGCGSQPAGSPPEVQSASPTTMLVPTQTVFSLAVQSLVEAVLAVAYTAIPQAKAIGVEAVPALSAIVLFENPQSKNGGAKPPSNPAARRLAVACLSAIGGSQAERVVVAALTDPDQSVQVAAYQELYKTGASPGAIPALLTAFEKSQDPKVRRPIALIVGRIEGAKPADIQRRCTGEVDVGVQNACVAARAKLGDKAAQSEFLRRLAATSANPEFSPISPGRKEWLEYVEYEEASWVLLGLIPLLDDKSQAIRVGGDDMPGEPEYLRVCDVVVNLTAKVTGHTFSFVVNGKTTYADSAIAEARRHLTGLSP